jgi:hypothetical protein
MRDKRFPVIILMENGKPTATHEEICEYMRAICAAELTNDE